DPRGALARLQPRRPPRAPAVGGRRLRGRAGGRLSGVRDRAVGRGRAAGLPEHGPRGGRPRRGRVDVAAARAGAGGRVRPGAGGALGPAHARRRRRRGLRPGRAGAQRPPRPPAAPPGHPGAGHRPAAVAGRRPGRRAPRPRSGRRPAGRARRVRAAPRRTGAV
ncbi:MAG: 2-amino-4-hydroxy-6-hydroxymethyldihydropteridinepyrophosphokinase, partial [uncultured Pseudonocardia sp.]